jgi:hypothetical protein
MSDPKDELLRVNARKLASDLLRDPFLAVAYRDAVVGAMSDSDPGRLITRWIVKAGYGTRDDLLCEELINAARTNLAAWDGAYLVVAQPDALVALEINEYGVRVDGCRVSDVSFIDGVLAFGPSKTSPWAGELRFKRVAPPADQPISAGGVYQSLCEGKLWRKGSAKPSADNAHGATKRAVLAASKPRVPLNALNAIGAESAAGAAADSKTFLGQWSGKYDVSLTDKPQSPRYGVSGDSDQAVQLTYFKQFVLDVTSGGQTVDHIQYSDGNYNFDLTFGAFSENVRAFLGFIYAVKTAKPAQPNAQGVSETLPRAETFSTPVIIALSGAGVIFAALTAVLTVVAAKLTDYFQARRERAAAEASGDAKAIDAAKKKESDTNIAMQHLKGQTSSNDPVVGVTGDQQSAEAFTDSYIATNEQNKIDQQERSEKSGQTLRVLEEDLIPSEEKKVADAMAHRKAVEEEEVAGSVEEAIRLEEEARAELENAKHEAEKARDVKESHDQKAEISDKHATKGKEIKAGFDI